MYDIPRSPTAVLQIQPVGIGIIEIPVHRMEGTCFS